MTTAEVVALAKQIQAGKIAIKKAEENLKKMKAQHRENEAKIVEAFTEEMITELELDSFKIKTSYENKISIKGGELDNTNKSIVLPQLVDLGYLDGEEVKTILNVHATKLRVALNNFRDNSTEAYDKMIEQGLLSCYSEPTVKILKSNKTNQN